MFFGFPFSSDAQTLQLLLYKIENYLREHNEIIALGTGTWVGLVSAVEAGPLSMAGVGRGGLVFALRLPACEWVWWWILAFPLALIACAHKGGNSGIRSINVQYTQSSSSQKGGFHKSVTYLINKTKSLISTQFPEFSDIDIDMNAYLIKGLESPRRGAFSFPLLY